jgi:hypothetical protein
MRRFWTALYIITALSQITFAIGARHVLAAIGAPGASWIAVLAAALLVALLRGRIRRGVVDRPIARWRRLLVEEPYYVHWCAALCATALFAVTLPLLGAAWIARGEPPVAPGALAAGCYAAGLALAAYGVLIRRRWLRVRTLDVPIPGLGAAFDGYRIAHLSDLHIGSLCPRARADAWVDRANALGADLCALTGDYVTSGVAFHEDIAAALTRLRARDGAIAVMGNHDYFGDGEPLISLLRAGGLKVLRNEHTVIARGADRLTVAGVDDVWTRRADVDRALAGRDRAIPAVVLAHDPALFPKLAARGAALVLSGHTHWGQLAVPFLARYNLSALIGHFRFNAETYRKDGATLYVHPGMGTTGPPVRLGAPPEITVLRLRCAGADASALEAAG